LRAASPVLSNTSKLDNPSERRRCPSLTDMADMGNSNSSESGGDNDGVVNWVALVISLVALLGTFAQVFQQYIASAAGYSNCGESVMGRWHESKKRKFRATELRFEVEFETPVIFVCPTTNNKGPIKKQPIYFVDGTDQSLRDTRALLPQQEEAQRQSLQESTVHTADNERASWVVLLSQLQSMEKESQAWQLAHYKENPPQAMPPVDFSKHTLAVALQAKKRSWDTMPAGVKKPYATTTMCHLLEIVAMMGIHWKEFDRSRERYRAEGNGYILMGTNVPELGIMFTLQVTGKSRFQENRVIPVDEVKELCCGYVSTLFRENKDERRVEVPNEDNKETKDSKDLNFLQLGSLDEIAETMVLIECNTDTAKYFRSPDAKHGHLFPGTRTRPLFAFSLLTRQSHLSSLVCLGRRYTSLIAPSACCRTRRRTTGIRTFLTCGGWLGNTGRRSPIRTTKMCPGMSRSSS
jgi:hypothetical protein